MPYEVALAHPKGGFDCSDGGGPAWARDGRWMGERCPSPRSVPESGQVMICSPSAPPRDVRVHLCQPGDGLGVFLIGNLSPIMVDVTDNRKPRNLHCSWCDYLSSSTRYFHRSTHLTWARRSSAINATIDDQLPRSSRRWLFMLIYDHLDLAGLILFEPDLASRGFATRSWRRRDRAACRPPTSTPYAKSPCLVHLSGKLLIA